MRISLIGMAGSGKSYWSKRLAQHGFRRFCCDDLIAEKLSLDLTRPDGTKMEMGAWMGFPYERDYKQRETIYLTYEIKVLTEILAYLESHNELYGEDIVIDTTGSVIYTGDKILQKLGRYTTCIYLLTPPEIQEQLLKAYISNPHPMLWRDSFSKRSGETNYESLARCYPQLLSARKRLYARYADIEIDYYRRNEKSFTVTDFLQEIQGNKANGT
jgi:shikimate kinase